jgi:molybdopterin-guanine dinucleotide biosynthesis protein A
MNRGSGALLVGLFVGGQGTRMGGVAKGTLPAPDSELSLVERLLLEIRAAVPEAAIALVGEAAAYRGLELDLVADDPAGVGPIGGLAGLLNHAERQRIRQVLALACDLPRLDRGLIARLATEAPEAAVVLVKQDATRNPLIARYAVGSARQGVAETLGQGRRSLQAVLDRLEPDVVALQLSPTEASSVDDWDTPSDIGRAKP